jgi:hypothetical protein
MVIGDARARRVGAVRFCSGGVCGTPLGALVGVEFL